MASSGSENTNTDNQTNENEFDLLCVCNKSCTFPGIDKLADGFKTMKEKDMISTLRSMVLSLAATAESQNKLTKRPRLNTKKNISTKFVLRSNPVCKTSICSRD